MRDTNNNTILDEQQDLTIGTLNGHRWVDLGLPSGTKWATSNVGSETPEGYGSYFAYGEVKAKDIYDKELYIYYDDFNWTKYTSLDKKTTLEASDDVATINWGTGWRIPTGKEMKELIDNCRVTRTIINGVSGRLFIGRNGNSIFLPAAGYINGSARNYDDLVGYYWSSSLNSYDQNIAWYLFFYSDNCFMDYEGRHCGLSVRPVCVHE